MGTGSFFVIGVSLFCPIDAKEPGSSPILNVNPLLPGFVGIVEGFSVLAAGVLSFCNTVAVVLTVVTAVAGGFGVAVVVLLAKDAIGCLGMVGVLVGTGIFCTTAGFTTDLAIIAVGTVCTAVLAGLGGATTTLGVLLVVTGVEAGVVETGLSATGFSCLIPAGCLEGGTASWVTELATGLDGVGGALVECPAELVWQCQEEQNEI